MVSRTHIYQKIEVLVEEMLYFCKDKKIKPIGTEPKVSLQEGHVTDNTCVSQDLEHEMKTTCMEQTEKPEPVKVKG